MAYRWVEFYELARHLLADDRSFPAGISPETLDRCAVSRAYYAAYGHAWRYVRENFGVQPGESVEDHESLLKVFRERGRGDTAAKLKNLRTWRNACDYGVESGGEVRH